MRRAKLVEDQYDPDIVEFEADNYVLLNHAQTIAQQRTVGGHDYEISHFQIGEEDLKLKITDDIAAGEKIILTAENCEGNMDLLGVSSTIVVKGVPGYENGSQTKRDNGPLVLFVVKADEEAVTCRPINGITKVEGQKSEYLREYTSPAIPAGTEMIITSTAASESQMIVKPDNSQPPKTKKRRRRAFPAVSSSVPSVGNGYGCKTDAVQHDSCRSGRHADKERFFQRCAGVHEPVRRQGLNMHGRPCVSAHPQGRS